MCRYTIYRVHGSGTPEARLTVLSDPGVLLRNKVLRLCLVV